MNVTVVPVEGRFINGVPAVKKSVPLAEAKRLEESGAFIIQRPTQGRSAKTPKE